MATAPLARWRLLTTSDVDQARRVLTSRFCPHRLEPTSAGAALDVVCNGASLGSAVTLTYLRYGCEVRITPGRCESLYLAQIPLAGTARVRVGDAVITCDRRHGTLGSPTEPIDMLWSADCEQLVVAMRRTAVEEVAADDGARRLGRTVVFRPTLDLSAPGLRAWLRLVHLAIDDLEAGRHIFRAELAAARFEQALIACLLSTQPNTAYPAPSAAGSRVVRTVTAAIEAEPELAWRAADLAACAGVSVRALQEGFRRELGVSPLEQVRRVRLGRARHDLIAADPACCTVTEIAARWGFFHLGRFARAYQAVYQELPSVTLGR